MSDPFDNNADPFATAGDYNPTFKFDSVGASIAGVVTAVRYNVETKFGICDAVIDLRTDAGEDYTIWCSKASMLLAIADAVEKATGKRGAPPVGLRLGIRRVEDGEPTQVGYSAPHRFEAEAAAGGAAPAPAAAPTPAPAAARGPLV